MIHSFSCKNFYSFLEEATVDFEVNDNAPKNNGYFTSPSGSRLSKVEAVIGANASGKTNLLKILPFFKWLIVDSFTMNPDAPIALQGFAFGEDKNQPSELSVVFEIDGKIYSYSFILDKKKILSENLELTSFVKEKKGTKQIFSRIWNKETNRYDFEGENFGLPKGSENLLRSNASVISTAARLNHEESQQISKFWQKIETNAMESGWVGDPMLNNGMPQWFEALVFYSQNDARKKKVEKLRSRFNLGLDGINFEKEEQAGQLTIKNIHATHTFNGQKQLLPIQYESSGTKQLFILLKTILLVLSQGGIAILDEFDVNLHPEMGMALFNIFVQPETNPKNAQLLFSTHSHLVLSALDKYQIVLVEKNEKGFSESWRLDEMANVRADENYYTKYLAGAYGAVPKI